MALFATLGLVVLVLWAFSREGNTQSPFLPTGVSDASAPPVPDTNAQSPSGQLDNIMQAIANLEGFGIAGTRPTRDNNPGDLQSAQGMISRDVVGPGGIAQFADVGDGWDALGNWVKSHTAANPDWDFYDLTHFYATGNTQGTPAQGEADPDASAEYIAGYLGVEPTTPVSTVLGDS